MSVTTPPPVPVFGEADFNDKVLAFFSWFQTAVPEFNTLAILADGGTYQAQSSPNDTTAGKLMLVGAGGLLEEGVIPTHPAGANSVPPGFYRDLTSLYPSPAVAVLGLSWSSNRRAEIAASVSAGLENRFYGRTQNSNDVWSPIVQFVHNRNLVGAVSKSGGVPSGAVIERGTNSNGEYIRFADGTQICWREVLITDGADVKYDFPAEFIGVPAVYVGGSGGTGRPTAGTSYADRYRLAAITVISNGFAADEWEVRADRTAFGMSGAVASYAASIIAVGRWI